MHYWDGLWQHLHPNISAHCLPEAIILFNQEYEHEDNSFPHMLSPYLLLSQLSNHTGIVFIYISLLGLNYFASSRNLQKLGFFL